MRLVIMCACLALPALAQDAKVIALEPQDSKEVSKAYSDMKAAEERFAELKKKITVKYTSTNNMPHSTAVYVTADGRYTLDGWSVGIKFSEDFKVIVPDVPVPAAKTNPYGLGIAW